jgi:hypothetical protein
MGTNLECDQDFSLKFGEFPVPKIGLQFVFTNPLLNTTIENEYLRDLYRLDAL